MMKQNMIFLVMFGVAAQAFAEEEPKARIQNGVDESIYVVQKRAFTKKNKFELTPMFFAGINPKFVGYIGAGLSGAYHIRENLAIELSSSIPGATHAYYSNLVGDVYAYENLVPEAVDLKHMKYFGSANVQFSALYGKFRFSIFSFSTLIDYDAYISAGIGVAQTLEPCVAGTEGCSEVVGAGRGLRNPIHANDEFKLAGSVGGGMRFFFSDYMGIRFEVRDLIYSDRNVDERQNVSTDVRNNVLFLTGLSFLI